jgi:hypothetical protein
MTTEVVTEYVYVGRDNTIDLLLKADGVVIALDAAVTKMEMKFSSRLFGAEYINSESNPGVFDWDTKGADGIVIIALGGLAITAGKDSKVELIVYDNVNTNGIVWGTVPIKVITDI